jgi:hypothetical protein
VAGKRRTISVIAVSAADRLAAWDFMEEGSMAAFIGERLTTLLRGLLLLVVAGVLVSCATIDATTTQYVGAPHFPPSDPAAVAILRSEPIRPHERLGEIVVDASTEPAPPIAEVEDKLRAEAAKLGADAVVVVLDRVQPVGAFVSGPWFGRDVDVIKGRKVVGVAIKYRR